jgi:hypothetical protein
MHRQTWEGTWCALALGIPWLVVLMRLDESWWVLASGPRWAEVIFMVICGFLGASPLGMNLPFPQVRCHLHFLSRRESQWRFRDRWRFRTNCQAVALNLLSCPDRSQQCFVSEYEAKYFRVWRGLRPWRYVPCRSFPQVFKCLGFANIGGNGCAITSWKRLAPYYHALSQHASVHVVNLC